MFEATAGCCEEAGMHGVSEQGSEAYLCTLSFRASGNTADRSRSSLAVASGFTLLEVMIALAIMAGVILTVITSFNYHLDLVSRDREETDAVLLARAKLEEPGFATLEKSEGTFAPNRPEMSWATETAPTDLPGLMRLTLTVSWGEGKRKLSLVEYVQK